MDKSLTSLCDALKKIIGHLKPQSNPVSFLLMTGKRNQGKSTLLRQSNFTHFPVDGETSAHFYYNQQGVILELGEAWLNQTENLIAYTLKQLNRCHSSVRISGILLCVDSSELLLVEPVHLLELCKSHAQLLERFGQALGYPVDTALLFTKLDALAGFSDFYQTDHPSDLTKPLGFSLNYVKQRKKLLEIYRHQFDQMIEVLGQQIINKLHPARSTQKRTLIREFPLQLASLRVPAQSLIQNLPLNLFRIKAMYFTSAEQGGVSVDRLNEKIQHEYALAIQDKFPQSNNYKAYFIEGALKAFQEQTKRFIPHISSSQKWLAGVAAGTVGLSLIWLICQHFKTTKLLDEASKELLTYEALLGQTESDKTSALYHLSLASNKLEQIPSTLISVPIIEQLKVQLRNNTANRLSDNFIPDLTSSLEQIIADPAQTQIARYEALKIYLMLSDPEHYSEAEVTNWFSGYWKQANQQKNIDKQLLLLKNALRQPMQPLTINRQIVSDARNYLNALPATYLYYSLAKNNFSSKKQEIAIEGFDLPARELPNYFTRSGFKEEIAALPKISAQLQRENWVLARQDLDNLPASLEEAYCFEYVTWWQNFIRHTRPVHYQDYQQARQLTQTLHQKNSVAALIELIQQQTGPDVNDSSSQFNSKVANQFTTLNLMSASATNELTQNINELEKFLTTLSLVNDQGRTVFELTKTRFIGGTLSDPLSTLYNRARQLPEPVSTWAKQLADDTWFIFIHESKNYLNRQWQQLVYRDYQATVANRYPLDPAENNEIALADFDHFFAPQGTLNSFVSNFIKPFLDTSVPQWQPKELNGYVLPISSDITNELIRANVISKMFFPDDAETSRIEFSLQKINLDPVVSNLQLTIGSSKLSDNQGSDSFTQFNWPQNNAKLVLYSIDGNHFEIEETGPWAFFKMLQKVNVLVDSNDSSSLQILFEVNGNSGRYVLKTQNPINPFSPGILTGFVLKPEIT
ncbi:type VI secretion protein IcmF [Legionella massiliensis]|uniref:Type VI secretion protein IcmF n=1 Tax=Legionella massiliensis TaxID=1034943 RepID=A0A078KZ14_9GAMM|nr:type IVB secretion system protein IcmF [Legionella massiliensis]CDZ76928.1 type VI secretion protein IcmF [Legionella massiliensis]CEE12666.1 Intracellular multiplication and human macrophage-killing [Legionella massiliensis]